MLVVSAGTNDDPRERLRVLAVRLGRPRSGRARSLRRLADIARPPVGGATYSGLNRVLARADRRNASLVLVDWVGMVRRNPRWLGRDGVHASAAGYRARARAIATAVKTRCAT